MDKAPTLAELFYANTKALTQAQIDGLVVRRGVPILALVQDGDGTGWDIGAAKVERVGRRFEFLEDGVGAFVVVARDEDGFGEDLVAWEPREGWAVPWVGVLPLLGQHRLLAPRMREPLRIHRDFLSWLKGGRNGAVILSPTRARRLLEGILLEADDIEHGLALRRALEPPTPRILVRAAATDRVAA